MKKDMTLIANFAISLGYTTNKQIRPGTLTVNEYEFDVNGWSNDDVLADDDEDDDEEGMVGDDDGVVIFDVWISWLTVSESEITMSGPDPGYANPKDP